MMRMKSLLLPLALALLLCLTGAHATETSHREFMHCLERGKCTFKTVCGFTLEADPTRCFMQTCVALEGHIMAIHNDLDYAVNVTWDVVGRELADDGVAAETILPTPLTIGGQSTRYLDTHLPADEFHSVRLQINAQTVAVVLTSVEDGRCTADETCDYLLHACYGVSDNPLCVEYARHCHGFAKVDEERRAACIPACLDTYYGHFFRDSSAYAQVNSDVLMAILLELKRRGVDLTDVTLVGGSSTVGELGAEGGGGGGGYEEEEEFDLCTLTKCHHGDGSAEECADSTGTTTALIIVAAIILILVAGIIWYCLRSCRSSVYHGATRQDLHTY